MKALHAFVAELQEKGIRLALHNGGLRVRGDQKSLSAEIMENLKKYRDQIVALLKTKVPFALLSEAERAQLEGSGEQYEDAYPLSALQAGMVFHTQLEQFSGIYHDIVTHHLRCEWNRTCFEEALGACIAEHPVLRSGFHLEGERPLQVVYPMGSLALPLEIEDLRGQREAQQEQYLGEWLERRKRHVFEWRRGPLLSVHIFQRGEESLEFALSFHHAVLDGWSRATLTNSLYQRYERRLRGESLAAVLVNRGYRDFIAQEQQVLQDEGAREHFARLLEDAPSEQLPRRRTSRGELRDQQIHVVSGFADLSPRLLQLARELGVPVQTVLLAVHFKVLSVLSGGSRVLSCVTHNGRPEQAGGDQILGLFLNSLPLALAVGAAGSWRELIEAVTQLSTQSLRYRHYPMVKIQQHTGREFSEVGFLYTHFHVLNEIRSGAGERMEVLGGRGYEQTNFDLLLDISRSGLEGDRLELRLVYDAGVYEAALMERMGRYYQRACEGLLAGLSERHAEQSLLSTPEREQLLSWGRGRAVAMEPGCVHESFEAQVRRTPEAVAAVCGEQQLSYAQLGARATRLSAYLQECGVGVGSRVGIYLTGSIEQLIGVLGVLRSGAAYVPLDPTWPAERVRYVLGDAGIERVLVSEALLGRLPLEGVDVVRMDGSADQESWLAEYEPGADAPEAHAPGSDAPGSGAQGSAAVSGARPEDLAYVIYTSGSTGAPKGVMVEHRQVQHYLQQVRQSYLTEELVGGVVSTPLVFDATVTTLLGPLMVGKRVLLLGEDVEQLPELLRRLSSSEEGWLFKVTPAHLQGLLQLSGPAQESSTRAHCVVVGGEALPSSVVRHWQARLPRARFVNEYGPTEATVGCSVYEVVEGQGLSELAVPIGRPIGNTQLYVLDEAGALVPPGMAGELYVGGAGVTRGYLNREPLTAERFVEDRFAEGRSGSEGGSRLYRTGDRVRWLANGELEYLGRTDDQVKVRGYRIELGEIEQSLSALEELRAAAVVVREEATGQKRLVGYVVPSESAYARYSSDTLIVHCRESLQRRLPQYMVPAAWMVLESLPLTPNGKVDRKGLPAPEQSGSPEEYVAARTPIEQVLCEVWQQVLGRERVGIAENFFSIGGDSILSIRVVALLKERGLRVSIRELFESPTVGELAEHVQADVEPAKQLEPFALLSAAERAQLEASGEQYEDAYPLSALQAGMVFHTQLEQFSGIYHDIVTHHLRCEWNRTCFEEALGACIAEHPVLRSGFHLEGERPLQVVYPMGSLALPLEIEDLRGQREAQQEQYLGEWLERRKRHVFEWRRGPLLSVHIFQRGEESLEFALSFHHAVLDGWSRATLTNSLYQRYERRLRGESLAAVLVNRGYRDFIAQEQQVLQDEGAREHFARLLEDAPSEQLPRRRTSRGELRDQQIHVVSGFADLSSRLLQLARELGVPVQTVLLAVHFKVLSVLSGGSRVLSCVTHNGRPEQAGGDQILGLFLNSLPLALAVGAAGSWRELIEAVTQLSTQSLRYRHYPMVKIQQHTGRELSEVLFNYTHFHVLNEIRSGAGEAVEVLGGRGYEQTNFDLLLDISRGLQGQGDRLELQLRYDPGVYESALIERMGRYYQRACEGLLAGLDGRHAEQSLLSTPEREQLLSWGRGRAVPAEHGCVHESFEAQVRRTPEAVAVVFADQQLTYAQLNTRANRLAHRLREQGVGAGSRVGLCLERSVEMVVGILGVLKAGAGYVPLDPAHPRERLEYVLGDCGAQLLLTQRSLEDRLPGQGLSVRVYLDRDEQQWEGYSVEDLPRQLSGVDEQSLAYVIYTSGSTGAPKGVMVEHRQVQRLFSASRAHFEFDERDVWTLFHSYAFDFSVWELWGALLHGGRVVVVPEWVARSPEDFHRLLREQRVTVLNQTPTAFVQLSQMDEQLSRESSSSQPLSVRMVIFGGEALQLGRLRTWVSRHGDERPVLVNMYGITETTVHVTYRRLKREDLQGSPGSVIGRPLADLSTYVLDEGGALVPPGVAGELYVGGAGVARGYLNRETLTRERFIEDRFGSERGSRLYRTGDRVRWLADGELEYLGRTDDQVKVRGYRIELGEIEQSLNALEELRAAAVVVREEASGQKRLVGYVVPSESAYARYSSDTLIVHCRESLQRRLPEYMVPAAWVVLDSLPLTPNGKVDRKGLPAPEQSASVEEYVAPRTATEQVLCEVWQQVLGRERVGIEENFFSIGGDSILSIRVVARANRAGVAINTRQVFEHQTIAELAQAAGTAGTQERPQQAVEGALALLPIQKSFLQEDPERVHHYNQAVLLHAPVQLTPGQLQGIVRSLYERHDALRLRFARNDAGQWHAQHQSLSESMVRQSCIVEALPPEQAGWNTLIQERCEVHQRALDIHQGPLFKVVYLQGTGGARLLVVAHHLVVDGVSWRIVLNDLQQSYKQQQRGESIRLSTKSSSYQQWGEALGRYARSDDVQKQRAYWLAVWEEPPEKRFPSHPSQACYASTRSVAVSLNAQETSALLKASAARARMQINELMLSGVYLGLRRWSGNAVQRIALEGHGREDLFEWLDTSETVGWFTTIYPLRLHSTTEDTGDVLTAVKERYREVPYHGIGYGLLRDVLEDATVRAAEALGSIDLVFNYLGQFDATVQELGEFAPASEPSGTSFDPQRRRGHRLGLNGMVSNGELRFQLDYSEQEYEQESIQQLAAQIERALRDVIAHCTGISVGGLWVEQPSQETAYRADLVKLLYPVQEQPAIQSNIESGAI